jgi:hypothetical protein
MNVSEIKGIFADTSDVNFFFSDSSLQFDKIRIQYIELGKGV